MPKITVEGGPSDPESTGADVARTEAAAKGQATRKKNERKAAREKPAAKDDGERKPAQEPGKPESNAERSGAPGHATAPSQPARGTGERREPGR